MIIRGVRIVYGIYVGSGFFLPNIISYEYNVVYVAYICCSWI